MGLVVQGGKANTISPTAPANTSGSAYASGNALGIAFAIVGATAPNAGTGFLQNILVVDASGQSAPIDFYFFDQAPVSGVDKSAYTMNAADYAHFLGPQSLAAYVAIGSISQGSLSNIAMPIRCLDGKTLYCQMVVRGTPTYTSISALTLRFGFVTD